MERRCWGGYQGSRREIATGNWEGGEVGRRLAGEQGGGGLEEKGDGRENERTLCVCGGGGG